MNEEGLRTKKTSLTKEIIIVMRNMGKRCAGKVEENAGRGNGESFIRLETWRCMQGTNGGRKWMG